MWRAFTTQPPRRAGGTGTRTPQSQKKQQQENRRKAAQHQILLSRSTRWPRVYHATPSKRGAGARTRTTQEQSSQNAHTHSRIDKMRVNKIERESRGQIESFNFEIVITSAHRAIAIPTHHKAK